MSSHEPPCNGTSDPFFVYLSIRLADELYLHHIYTYIYVYVTILLKKSLEFVAQC